jgi:hypothetical protein
VDAGQEANSRMHSLIFSKAEAYTPTALDKKRRWQLRQAQASLVLKEFGNAEDFSRTAHPVYLAFHQRTKYSVGESRRDPEVFARWGQALFRIPGIRILGAWQAQQLVAVNISYRADETVYYATFFCNDVGRTHYSADLMLNAVREQAARTEGVRQIYTGALKHVTGLDDFYLHRGAELLSLPARLDLNPLVGFILRGVFPRLYRRLLGIVPTN